MVALYRVKTRWSGFSGSPGYTVLHFRDFDGGSGDAGGLTLAGATAASTRAYDFFAGFRSRIPTAVTTQVESQVDVVDSANGELLDSFGVPSLPAQIGAMAGTYNPAAGAVINWRTGTVRNGRRLRGRSFIVPIGIGNYSATGTLTPEAIGIFQTAANTLIDTTKSPDLFVFGRPSSKDANDGVASVVTSATVPAMLAVLRSRRD